jgi:hypothetical protein
MVSLYVNVNDTPMKLYPREWREVPDVFIHPVDVFDAPDLSSDTVFIIAQVMDGDHVLLTLYPREEEKHARFLNENMGNIGWITYYDVEQAF